MKILGCDLHAKAISPTTAPACPAQGVVSVMADVTPTCVAIPRSPDRISLDVLA